jgi:two-component system, LuxR family, sensor kinase FixL
MNPGVGSPHPHDLGGWTTVVWLLVASSSLTLGVIHLWIGIRQPRRDNLWFGLTALSNAAVAGFELALMRSTTPQHAGELIRWIHVPIFFYVASFVLFVRAYFDAGRAWLAGAAIGVRGFASLVVNFLRSPNLNFVAITGIRRIPFLGRTVSVPEGVISAWTRLGELSSLLLLAFLVDATATVWRRGDRRRAAVVGGSVLFCVLVGAFSTALIHRHVFEAPYMISLPYFLLLGVMSNELTRDVAKANELARDLREQTGVLHEVDQRLGLAAESADLGFWSWDAKTGRMWMSPRARALRGYAPDERLDLPGFLSSVHADDRDAVRGVVEAAAARGGAFEHEYRIVHPEGGIRWIAVHGAGERDASGGVHVRGVSIDTTLRKKAEAESRQREVELAHLSRVAMLGELSGSLAHELNQPLTAILSNAQAANRMIAQGIDTREELQEILSEIIAEDKRAGEVIRKMRGLLKKGEVRAEALDLVETVDDVVRLLHSDLLSRGVTVSTDFEAGLPRVQADRVQIIQVLLNLITNGCDAMEERSSEERLLLLSAARQNAELVQVSVADRGCGIDPADLERLFEPFVTTKPTGLGLGLAVCRTIVGAHGGRIWASNNAESGAAFHFTLPAIGARAH